MKRLLILALLGVAGLVRAQSPWFEGDLEAALQAAKAQQKHVFIHFDSDN